MAKNPPQGPGRKGAVKDRTQFQNPVTLHWYKRDKATGQIMDGKADLKPFKGVSKEKSR